MSVEERILVMKLYKLINEDPAYASHLGIDLKLSMTGDSIAGSRKAN